MTRIAVVVLFLTFGVISGGCSTQPAKTFDVTIECRSPNGKRDTKVLKRWKYDKLREAILKVLPDGETGMAFPELKEKVIAEFTQEDQMSIGKMSWYIETVTLEMETSGELERFPETTAPLPPNVRRAK
ncbi:MAG: hypothetical protein KDA89_13330 [Planctomycetaceae bacterium]|nr:hypothetical protein [Planctomycetaceae bacterium]